MSPLVGGATWRRWVFLVLGGAILSPYLVLVGLFLTWATNFVPPGGWRVAAQVAAVGVAVPLVALTAAVPAVRVVEATAARELLRGPATGLLAMRAENRSDRWRTAGWLGLHLGVGGVAGVLSVSVPPFAVALVVLPAFAAAGNAAFVDFARPVPPALGPVVGIVLLAAFCYLVAGLGALLARLAPTLLGPSAADRLAASEARAARLAERTRLARELHDSVGHALSVVVVQAGAAGRVLDTDPAFARRAMGAVENAARAALDDLDHVLGLLRDEGGRDAQAPGPRPTLADLDALLDQGRATGVALTCTVYGDLGSVPPVVSREAYRIVQEGLTNALRHAGPVPVAVTLRVCANDLELEVANPLRPDGDAAGRAGGDAAGRIGRAVGRAGGGRGLLGIRERAAVLRGRVTAGPVDGWWRTHARLPLHPTPEPTTQAGAVPVSPAAALPEPGPELGPGPLTDAGPAPPRRSGP